MSLAGLQERLSALQETTSQLRELIDRLAKIKFQPGSVPLGADEENSVSGELSAEISQALRGGLEDQELLTEEVDYFRPEGQEKARLQDGVGKVGKELAGYRVQFRQARLAARKTLLAAQKHERQMMMQSYAHPTMVESGEEPTTEQGQAQAQPVAPVQRFTRQLQGHSSLSEEDQQTVGASSNVTNALRRTHDLIASELSRSEFAHETLVESSAALKKLNESYGSLDGMLTKSRDLLGTLLRSQKSDTWYLQTAMYMLMATGAWLLFRRWLYGPMWWFVIMPLRVALGLGSTTAKVIMPKGSNSAASKPQHHAGTGGQSADNVKGMPEHVPHVNEKPSDAHVDADEEVRKIVEAAEAEAKTRAEDEERPKAEEKAKAKTEEEATAKAKAKAEEEAKAKAKAKAEEDAKAKAKAKAEEDAKAKAKAKAEEEAKAKAKAKAEEDARLKKEEEARLKKEEEARLKKEEEARLKKEEEAKLKKEEEAKLQLEKQAAEEEVRLKAEEEAELQANLEEDEPKQAQKDRDTKDEL